MTKGYILAMLDVADEGAYRASGYMAMAEAAVAQFGGRFLVRGGRPEALEGAVASPNPLEGAVACQRYVLLEFPSRDAAAQFYGSDQYAPAIALRQSLSAATLILLDGAGPASTEEP